MTKSELDNIFLREKCDRCGEVLYLRYIGTKEFEGGFTRINEFESKPKDWGWITHPITDATIHLCPSCMGKYKDFVLGFLDYKKPTNWEDVRYENSKKSDQV